jgi:LuxR family transcriptional regulator, maltose regulon positive regulatory protein
VTALVNELAELAEEAVLVLDDYHLIQAPAVHASVEFLLQHLPSSLRLVLAGRADPPLPLARLRGRGQLADLREAALSLQGRSDIGEFVEGFSGSHRYVLDYLAEEVLDGRNAYLSDGVQRALGRAPRDFADYARAAAATGVWNGSAAA